MPIDHLPYIISAPGTYYLTKNLTMSGNGDGIPINVGINVTIDLNGFAVIGTGSGTGSGVSVGVQSGLRVQNGVIRGWGGSGISANAATNAKIEGVICADNGQYGMILGSRADVRNCIAWGNHNVAGISVGAGSFVTGSVAHQNGPNGATDKPRPAISRSWPPAPRIPVGGSRPTRAALLLTQRSQSVAPPPVERSTRRPSFSAPHNCPENLLASLPILLDHKQGITGS